MSQSPHYFELAQLFQDPNAGLESKNRLLISLLERTKLSLIDLFRIAPPEVFVHYLCKVSEVYLKRAKDPIMSENFWEFIVTLLFLSEKHPS